MTEALSPSRSHSRTIAFVLALLCLAWSVAIYRGLGPVSNRLHHAWWEPSGFMREWSWITPFFSAPLGGIVLVTAPVATILLWLYLRPTPALARAGAATGTATTAILAFYGLLPTATSVWEFFDWRGSAVMFASGALIGCTLAAPDLARALRRRHPVVGLVLYFTVLLGISGLVRNATGWDATLQFNISPWPAIPVLALEIGAWTWVGVQLGLAIATASTALAITPARRAAGVALGAVVPVIWFGAAFPHTDSGTLLIGTVLSGLLVAVAVFATRGGREAMAERAAALALGAGLVLLPIVAGGAMADGDFAASKHVRARVIIDALASFYENEGAYPDSLDELVDLDYLERHPEPRVGSGLWLATGLTDAQTFSYRNLGSSYVLEFVATEWVMCSYNPPWNETYDEEDDFEEEAPDLQADFDECLGVCGASCDSEEQDCDQICGEACEAERIERAAVAVAEAEDEGGEAWSCPDARPELW